MASDLSISVEGLSKCYRVGHQARREAHPTLRDQLVRHARNLARKTRDMATGQVIVQGDTVEDFWALRDVSFDIPQGARVGILGRNGAGKSTLLKLLSRITEPTSGRIKINGRVASLLEVGTGFHPELTGRENIFLNGAILGMSRREIQGKFDEIVAFAEVERFLDTPVKRYSSGMYVRLAFAVAAHLEPEILIVDEVLAVGDAQFQKKCLGKMDEVGKSGRTVLFVSHNMAAISQLCQTAVLLQQGQVLFIGSARLAVEKYLESGVSSQNPVDLRNRQGRHGDGLVAFQRVCVQDGAGNPAGHFSMGEDIVISLDVHATCPLDGKAMSVDIKTDDGVPVCHLVSWDSDFRLAGDGESYTVNIKIRDVRFFPGKYQFSIWCAERDGRQEHDYVEAVAQFEIVDGGALTTRSLSRGRGLFFLTPEWTATEITNQSKALIRDSG